MIKDGLAPFIKQYGEQIYSSEEVNEATNRAVVFLCGVFEYVPKAIDILNKSLGVDEANLITNAWAAFEAGTATARNVIIPKRSIYWNSHSKLIVPVLNKLLNVRNV